MKPSETIEFGPNTGITITCQYNLGKSFQFVLVQNYNDIVFQTDFDQAEGRFKITVRRKGFHCTPFNGSKGQITCWKFNPTCDDATHYTCKSDKERSTSKTLKVGSQMNTLKILNPPIEVDKPLIFICSANIGVPKTSTYFVWFERTRVRVNAFPDSVNAVHRGKCFNLAVSTFNYTLAFSDAGSANITCFLNGRTLTERLTPTEWERIIIADNAGYCSMNTFCETSKLQSTHSFPEINI
ncbi:uncharacterized protein LOC106880708 [Octopus bimaculoides]|uniref:uncharacterized protein LOC106880708 n=1 Tax=Octopus bimaculoides TaxID=37653 RepID=UPI00071CFC53|nr:uncharacterized protein LOC106880708 [Octopus bimaculoides]|eukprot:XP_014786270.1 PREDICTED: uncharacterized protein LOC106880708 [Octopus bimaculoides]